MENGIQVSSLKPLLQTPEQVREAFAKMKSTPLKECFFHFLNRFL